jgi:protein SCO1/2
VNLRAAAFAVLVSAGLVGVGGGVVLHRILRSGQAPAALKLPELHGQAVWPAGRRPAPAFALRNQSGALITPASFRGRTVVLTFLDSHCKSRCPLVGRELAWVVARLPERERPAFVVVSVNPKDTPSSAVIAALHWGLPVGWQWLLGDRKTLAYVWRSYGITVVPSTHDVVHSLAVYLLDRHGDERAAYLFPFQPPFVQGDLRALARERA